MGEGDDICDISNITAEEEPSTCVDEVRRQSYAFNDMHDALDASSSFIVKQLKDLYRSHVSDAEKRYHLHFNFCLPTDGEIKESEFDATPMVLLIGQYSTGKTTFLNHLLGENFPGMHIGPEPTTDKFMALYYNGSGEANTEGDFLSGFRKRDNNSVDDDSMHRSVVTDDVRASGRLVKGNTLTVTPNLPFSSLSQFGSAFLNHFVGSACHSPLLKRITFVDTPGVLSGEKQRINRTYDFGRVAKWFADRSDLILLLFDAHKLDISDEFKNVIDTIRQYNDDKIRCVLNKADCVTREQLVRVYGSLMWSMGKIFDSPEVVRVYTGSYWKGPLINNDFQRMFEKDEQLLLRELLDLPRCAAERKVNQMVNRIRLVIVHVCILGTISKMTPRFFGKKKFRDEVLKDVPGIMDRVRVEFDLSEGDMPNAKEFVDCLKNFSDFSVFPPIDKNLVKKLDSLISVDIPCIVKDADNIRLGRKHVVEEREIVEPQGSVVEDQPVAVEKSESIRGMKSLLMKSLVFFAFFLFFAEGIHYLAFSKLAHSVDDLSIGWNKILLDVRDHPKVRELWAKTGLNSVPSLETDYLLSLEDSSASIETNEL